MRIGVVGAPSDWLVASTPAAAAVAATWGPRLVPVDIAPVLLTTSGTRGNGLVTSVSEGAARAVEPDRDDIEAAAAFHPALRSVVAEHHLDALTVRCFDLVTELGTSGCLALAELNDAGVVAGCEGDVPSTLALLWVQTLLGRTGWMANPAQVDASTDEILLAHCTVPRSLVRSYELRSHFESGVGVALQGELPLGPVTVLRIGGRDLDRVWAVDAEAVPHEHAEGLCRTQLKVHLPDGEVARLLAAPLGNHLVVVAGHHASRLLRWWDFARVPA